MANYFFFNGYIILTRGRQNIAIKYDLEKVRAKVGKKNRLHIRIM